MNKITKRAIIAGGLIAGVSAGFLVLAGHYYVNVAIKRGKKKFSNKKRRAEAPAHPHSSGKTTLHMLLTHPAAFQNILGVLFFHLLASFVKNLTRKIIKPQPLFVNDNDKFFYSSRSLLS